MRHTHSYSLLGYVQIILLEASQPTPWLTHFCRSPSSHFRDNPESFVLFLPWTHLSQVCQRVGFRSSTAIFTGSPGRWPPQTLPHFRNLSSVCRTMMPMWRMPSGIGSTPGTTAGTAQIIQNPTKSSISSSSGSVAWILCLSKPSRSTIGWRDSSMVSYKLPNIF